MKKVLIFEVSNATDEQIQEGLGKAITDFCEKYKGTGITVRGLSEDGARKVKTMIDEWEGESE